MKSSKQAAMFKTLTTKELDLLYMLGNGHSVSKIAVAVCRSQKTIQAQLSKVRQKLNIETYHKLVCIANLWFCICQVND